MNVIPVSKNMLICGAWWLSGMFGALYAEGHRFESHSSRQVGTLASPSLAVACGTSLC